MKIAKVIIFVLFTMLLIVGTIDLARNSHSKAMEGTRIETPNIIAEYDHIRVNTSIPCETIPEEISETEPPIEEEPIETLEIKSIEHSDPILEMMWDLPINAETQLMIESMCEARGVDAAVVLSIIENESQFDENAVGDRGRSFGLMQIQERWHEERIERLGVTDLLDGSQNVIVGIDYLDELLDIYDGEYEKALTAYNGGHYNGKITAYAERVMEGAKKYDE